MGKKSRIEWTDHTWNPVVGCEETPVSSGCEKCCAKRMANRFSKEGMSFHGVVDKGQWTGDVKFSDEKLYHPFKIRNPSKIFVGSMGDIFYEKVTDTQLAQIFSVIKVLKKHTFILLTKRPKRMVSFLSQLDMSFFPHLWTGVSVENQETADQRIPTLLESPSFLKFVSCEPILDEINLDPYMKMNARSRIDWVISGGETGAGSRTCHFDWVDIIQRSCDKNDVPFFFKSWGDWIPSYGVMDNQDDQDLINKDNYHNSRHIKMIGDSSIQYYRVARKRSGNSIYGKQYHQYPESRFSIYV